MKKIIVKLSFEWKSLPIDRQTPNQAGEWGNFANYRKFYYQPARTSRNGDYWVVYGQLLKTKSHLCSRENTYSSFYEPLPIKKSLLKEIFLCLRCLPNAKVIC